LSGNEVDRATIERWEARRYWKAILHPPREHEIAAVIARLRALTGWCRSACFANAADAAQRDVMGGQFCDMPRSECDRGAGVPAPRTSARFS
jgi:hypothetical protein